MAGTKTFGEQVDFLIGKGYTKKEAFDAASNKFNITPDHHAAATYFKVTTEWHPVSL